MQLSIAGDMGSTFWLEFSTDWVTWASIATLTNTTGALQFRDAAAPTSTQRVYRLKNRAGTNSVYWQKAQDTHAFVVSNLLTSFKSYRNHPGSDTAFEWYSASQIYADAAMLQAGDARYSKFMNDAYSWMSNLWDSVAAAGGYFAAANVNGSDKGGGKFVDDHALTGNVYLDCYALTSGAAKSNYLASAKAIANWLMFSGQWDNTYEGGFWWSDARTVKPTQSNGLALQLFLRLYAATGQAYYRDWAESVKNWLERQMYDPSDGLYIWQIETNSFKNPLKFTYDNAIMIEADLLYSRVMTNSAYLAKAQTLTRKLNAKLWNSGAECYSFNSADARVNPCWCGWASQSLIKLYEADQDPAWLNFAQQNIDFINARLWDRTSGGYHTFCDLEGSSLDNRLEGVDQAWMQRIQAMIAAYR